MCEQKLLKSFSFGDKLLAWENILYSEKKEIFKIYRDNQNLKHFIDRKFN